MIITKEFLNKAFSHESIKKHAYHGHELAEGYEYKLSQKWVDWAYKHLTELEHEKALKIMDRKHATLLRNGDLSERNEFAKIWRCIVHNIDYGFKAGDIVRVPTFRKNGWKEARIVAIHEGKVEFEKFNMHITMLRKIDDKEQLSFEI